MPNPDLLPGDTVVAVIGLGYVGCVTAACLASLGHRVIGIDKDPYKVDQVQMGVAPFYEPGLAEVVREQAAQGRLSATTSTNEGLAAASIALICVGTPSDPEGNLNVEQVRRVTEEIAALLPGRSKPLIAAVRSTVFPGTCESVLGPLLQHGGASIVSNPEFLREGAAMKDFLEPSLLVVGGDDPKSVEAVAVLYRTLPVDPCRVSLRTAEMIKYACNAFHALKISFANEIGSLSAALQISADEVMQTLCRDDKLNISAAYLKPGFAFGGSCLPKDLRALTCRASSLNLEVPLLESILPSNEQHLKRAVQAVLDLPSKRLGIFGLAFKENTDDLRESPVVSLIQTLIDKGRNIRIYDPHIQLGAIYGSNEHYLLKAVPHIGKLLARELTDVTEWADHLVLAHNPGVEYGARIRASGLPAFSLVGSW